MRAQKHAGVSAQMTMRRSSAATGAAAARQRRDVGVSGHDTTTPHANVLSTHNWYCFYTLPGQPLF